MIAQKGLPALRRGLSSPGHVFGHRGLPDIDAKLEQFAVDPRCSPQRIGNAHAPDQLAQVRVDLWPATERAGFPAPVTTEPSPMPTHHGLRSENRRLVQD